MFDYKGKYNYKSQIHRVNALRVVLIFLAIALAIGIPLFLISGIQSKKNNERRHILQAWESGAYDAAYFLSTEALASKPMDYFLLTISGFSAFQLGISQLNNTDTLHYIDQCILNLRKAIQLKEAATDGRLFYVLGKAYYYKGEEYIDLTIAYLEKARELLYEAPDIPEYLGLAYAASGDFRSSVEAFTLALNPAFVRTSVQPSDLLLLSIARSYFELGEMETARAYLLHCLEISKDSKTIITARFLLAEIYINTGNDDDAEKQYKFVLDDTGYNGEAYYQLGEIYARRGNTVGARAQWRSITASDPLYQKAQARLRL